MILHKFLKLFAPINQPANDFNTNAATKNQHVLECGEQQDHQVNIQLHVEEE